MTGLSTDLDAAITNAVTARVEAEMLKAFSGDEVIAGFVTAALMQEVEVQDRNSYSKKRVPYLHHVLSQTIQEIVKASVQRLILEEMPMLEDEIRRAIRRNAGDISSALANTLTDAAERGYGIHVDVALKVPNG